MTAGSEPPRQRPTPGAVGLAVALPVLLLVVVLGWMGRPLSTERSRAAQRLDEELAAAPPEVVLVGNSLTNAGIDELALARALGLEPDRVRKLWVSYSQAPTWYALLENRLYENGHRPRLVIFVNTLEWMLSTAPDGAIAERRLADHMNGDDALILEKTFGQGPLEAFHHRARQRGTALRNGWLALLRESGVGLVLAEESAGSVRERGRALADPALERLFGDAESTDLELHSRVIPIVEVEREGRSRAAVSPEQSYLPDLARLVQEYGGKAIFVRVPLPPENVRRDQVDPETLAQSLETLRRAGAGWLDLSTLGLGAVEFADFVHMNWLGRERFTRALAEHLVEGDVLGDGALVVPRPPLRIAEARRSGEVAVAAEFSKLREDGEGRCLWRARAPVLLDFDPAPLRLAGLDVPAPVELLEDGLPLAPGTPEGGEAPACTGRYRIHPPGLQFSPRNPEVMEDPEAHLRLEFSAALPIREEGGREGWWVYPGTRVRLTVPEATPDEPLRLLALAVAFGPGAGTPSLRSHESGAWIPFARRGSLLAVRATVPASGATDGAAGEAPPMVVEIASPEDGPFVALRVLVAESPSRGASYLIGRAHLEQPPSLRLLGISRGFERQSPGAVAWARGPAVIDGLERESLEPGGRFELRVPRAAVPAKKALDRHTQLRARSNPLKVYLDGKRWPGGFHCASDPGPPGTFCPAGPRVRVSPFDGPDAVRDPARYELRLDEARRAQKGRWLYPGDRLRIRVHAHRGGLTVDALSLSGVAVDPDADGLQPEVEIRVRGRLGELAHERIPMSRFEDSAIRVELDGALQLDREGLEVEIATPADAPWFALVAASLEQGWPADESD